MRTFATIEKKKIDINESFKSQYGQIQKKNKS